jgi:glycosyltransferase involved in cell wall biosynthesis
MQIKDSENKNFHAILSTKNVDDKISPKNLYFIPDISDVTLPGIRKSSNAQLIDKRSQSKPKMLFIGNIKVDRGILEFLKVAESDKEQEIFYVICGLCEDDDLKDKIKSFAKEKNNIFIFLQFIENEIEYNEIVNTCDILWLNFREKNTNSSNNLYKAIYFDKPIILNPSGSLIELVRRFDIKCGTFTNPNAKEILKFKAYYELSSSRLESNRKYLEFNSMEKLEQILAEVFD